MAFRHLLGTSSRAPAIDGTRLGPPRSAWGARAPLCAMDSKASGAYQFDPFLTLSELAARLSVSQQTLYDLRSQGRGPLGFRIGRELRFRASEVDAWLARLEQQDQARDHGEVEQ